MKATRGLAIGLGLSRFLNLARADGDGIPQVGIGAVHPICDPLTSECISSDEQVQDEILADLEGDSHISGEDEELWYRL